MEQGNETSRNGKLRIILLEDNDNLRTVMTMLLTGRGYEVFSFSKPTVCPLQAQPACRCGRNQACTDVILTDLDMPEIDGMRFIEVLKKKKCKCRHVAVMSGNLTADDMYQAVRLGCSAFENRSTRMLFSSGWMGLKEKSRPRESCVTGSAKIKE